MGLKTPIKILKASMDNVYDLEKESLEITRSGYILVASHTVQSKYYSYLILIFALPSAFDEQRIPALLRHGAENERYADVD